MTAAVGLQAPLREMSRDFLDYLDEWMEARTPLPLESLIAEAGGPQHVGLFCVDVINGFCHEGLLQSPRVRRIIAPIVALFTAAYAAGVEHFVLTQDTHDPAAAEFASYPPHCIRGTSEARTVPELAELPFASRFQVLPKNSIHSAIGTGLDAWLEAHPQVTHRIVVGDCTDLCTYHLALHLQFRANAANQTLPVILPMDCVDTYDIPVDVARQNEIPAHPADLLHAVFLYSMAMNGVRIVRNIIL
jgi:nicotinamidase-related amidase